MVIHWKMKICGLGLARDQIRDFAFQWRQLVEGLLIGREESWRTKVVYQVSRRFDLLLYLFVYFFLVSLASITNNILECLFCWKKSINE